MIYHNSTGLMDYSSDNWLRNFDKAVTQWNPIKIGSRAKSRPINLFEFFGHLTADFFLEIIFVNLQNGSPCASFRHLRLCVDILRLLIKREEGKSCDTFFATNIIYKRNLLFLLWPFLARCVNCVSLIQREKISGL